MKKRKPKSRNFTVKEWLYLFDLYEKDIYQFKKEFFVLRNVFLNKIKWNDLEKEKESTKKQKI